MRLSGPIIARSEPDTSQIATTAPRATRGAALDWSSRSTLHVTADIHSGGSRDDSAGTTVVCHVSSAPSGLRSATARKTRLATATKSWNAIALAYVRRLFRANRCVQTLTAERTSTETAPIGRSDVSRLDAMTHPYPTLERSIRERISEPDAGYQAGERGSHVSCATRTSCDRRALRHRRCGLGREAPDLDRPRAARAVGGRLGRRRWRICGHGPQALVLLVIERPRDRGGDAADPAPAPHGRGAGAAPLSRAIRAARASSMSFATTWIVPAIGIAKSAPRMPSSDAPARTAISTSTEGM